MQVSCNKKDSEFIEFTYGRSMNPELPRAGIKIKKDDYVYYCEEIVNLGEKYYINNKTGKYKFYKSEEKVQFSKYKNLVIENFSQKINKNNKGPEDATYEQIDYELDSKKVKKGFFDVQLNQNQKNIKNEIWELKNKLKFNPIDSIYFNQERLQEKLPEPPKLEK